MVKDSQSSKPMKNKSINSFFKKNDGTSTSSTVADEVLLVSPIEEINVVQDNIEHVDRISNLNDLERDPGLRKPIWKYGVNEQDDIRRKYINLGPWQPILKEYPKKRDGNQFRRFNSSWFISFPWLEYSESQDKAFCFPCYLFDNNPPKFLVFTISGFSSWKRVKNGSHCSFRVHEGEVCSLHYGNLLKMENLKNASLHIDKVLNAQSSQQIIHNRLRLTVSIEAVKWLAKQACAFRGHDESNTSSNRGNFIEMIKLLAKMNGDVNNVVLENAPGNAMYVSPMIQKELLNILANNIRGKIREEIGFAKFCILVDEALDESKKEQMAIILRFVDDAGFIQERFFDIVSVGDTSANTLKIEICRILSRHDLLVENMRGQGYDGASNMRGAWNGLQALFLEECKFAYYVHCFAHRLQLALVAAAKDVHKVWLFFSKLHLVVNFVCGSAKRYCEVKSAKVTELANLLAREELETGKGANQMRALHRPGATRWSSHFASVNSLIEMYEPVCTTLEEVAENDPNSNIQGEATGVLEAMTSFDFVFILLLMNEVMGITDILCRELQSESQDILTALRLVASTKELLQELRHDGWDVFFQKVITFCEEIELDIPDMNARYMKGAGRPRKQKNQITFDHYYRVDIFNEVIDFQLIELNERFPDRMTKLLTLSSALDPVEKFKLFDIDSICYLAKEFYPHDFTKNEIEDLRRILCLYKKDVLQDSKFTNLSSLHELCQKLTSNRSRAYYLIDRLIRLVLTLPVSTATTERAFSAMKRVKTILRNKMDDAFLADCMIINIERDIVDTISSDSVIDEFYSIKKRKAQLK